jgi:hypothetical protein
MSAVDPIDAALATTLVLGSVHFRISDPDASDLGIAIGALAEGEPNICLRAVFTPAKPGSAMPQTGDVVALPDDDGLTVVFEVAAVHGDLHELNTDEPGHSAMRDEILQPGEVLLVQLINSSEEH